MLSRKDIEDIDMLSKDMIRYRHVVKLKRYEKI